jgi:hypothetical protein
MEQVGLEGGRAVLADGLEGLERGPVPALPVLDERCGDRARNV